MSTENVTLPRKIEYLTKALHFLKGARVQVSLAYPTRPIVLQDIEVAIDNVEEQIKFLKDMQNGN